MAHLQSYTDHLPQTGQTPLHNAALSRTGGAEMVGLLLRAGADTGVRDNFGEDSWDWNYHGLLIVLSAMRFVHMVLCDMNLLTIYTSNIRSHVKVKVLWRDFSNTCHIYSTVVEVMHGGGEVKEVIIF